MQTKPSIEHCFSVTFVQNPSPEFFDIAENQWIIKTLLPKIK